MHQQSHVIAPIDEFIVKMRRENIPEAAIAVFVNYYRQLADSQAITVPESTIDPLSGDSIPNSAAIQHHATFGMTELKKTAILKLNGGLGTTMGLHGPKSLIIVKDGLSFLEISINQIRHINNRLGVTIPLLLMNSFFTDATTRDALKRWRDLPPGLVEPFLQHKFPKVKAPDILGPIDCPEQPAREWNPAGHGDLLLSLKTSGLLDELLNKGYRYLFVSNIDNLGADINAAILGFFVSEKLDFLMEVTDRTPMDRKGGHLAKLKNGGLVLREASQCGERDKEYFSDISRHRFFNTNNLWLNLESVSKTVDAKKHEDMLLIINRKKLDPSDPCSSDVLQLESALGSAIGIFEKSGAIRVDRSRFAPVKNCDELLLVRSDYFQLLPDFRIGPNSSRASAGTIVSLDPAFYSTIDLLEQRFPFGSPSLVDCTGFTVKGDVTFGRNVTLHGQVAITNKSDRQVTIEDNAVIAGNITFGSSGLEQ